MGLHWAGRFYEFVPQNGDVRWEVQPWGAWKVGHFRVKGTALQHEGMGPPCRSWNPPDTP